VFLCEAFTIRECSLFGDRVQIREYSSFGDRVMGLYVAIFILPYVARGAVRSHYFAVRGVLGCT